MTQEQTQTLSLRSDFYRDKFKMVMMVLLLLVIVNAALVLGIVYNFLSKPVPLYFGAESDGRMIPVDSLNEPMLSEADLLQWVTGTVINSYSYDYINYVEKLKAVSEHYTNQGWESLQAMMRQSGNLQVLVDNKMVATAEPTGAPVILDSGVIDGRYTWKVKLPVLIKYEGARDRFRRETTITMVVIRVDGVGLNNSVAIAQINSTEEPIQRINSL